MWNYKNLGSGNENVLDMIYELLISLFLQVYGVGNISSFAGYPPMNNLTKIPKQTQLGQIENVFISTSIPGQSLSILLWENVFCRK